MDQQTQSRTNGSYTANLLGNIRSHLAGLQSYDVMALELTQNADDAKAEEIIFDITDRHHIALLQTLSTEKSTRLGAVDVRTGRLYLPSAKLGPPIPPHPWPSAVPGSFHVLVVSSAGGS